jgi:hypothetical protein
MSLIPVFNKNLPRVHTESELGVLGVHGKLVKYVVHSSKRKKLKHNYFSSHKLPKQQSTSFWSQGILGVKDRKNPTWRWILDAIGCSFALLRRVYWPVLEKCYELCPRRSPISKFIKQIKNGQSSHDPTIR